VALKIVHDTYFAPLVDSGLAFDVVNRNMIGKSAGLPQNVRFEPAFWFKESITRGSDGEYDSEVAEWV
jgi:hypothetical protein